MNYEEAIGVGRVISPLQRKMLLDLDNWPRGAGTDYNREELIWKRLILRDEEFPSGCRLTPRGLEVKSALLLNMMSDKELLSAFDLAEVESWRCERICREMEDRQLAF